MRVDLPNTTVPTISKELVRLREEGGAVALGRVLTLVIMTNQAAAESAIDAANAASREHPMRVVVLIETPHAADRPPRLDAEIRVGGDAGASEVIVLRAQGDAGADTESLVTGLLLADAPVVAWWSADAPERVAHSPVGGLAHRRITDVKSTGGTGDSLAALAEHFTPGDTDLAWTRITLWRSQLAAVLDQPPYEPIERVEVVGAADSASAVLLAAWLGLQLETPVTLRTPHTLAEGYGISQVTMVRASGAIVLTRTSDADAELIQPGQPVHEVAIPLRTNRECLAEELRRLDPDEVYARVLTLGLARARTVEG